MDLCVESLTKHINGHGYSEVMSFGLKADHDTHNRFARHSKRFTY